jgi:hypothetical protein
MIGESDGLVSISQMGQSLSVEIVKVNLLDLLQKWLRGAIVVRPFGWSVLSKS